MNRLLMYTMMKMLGFRFGRIGSLMVVRGLVVAVMVLLVTSCTNMTRFPISTVTPAADIVAVRGHDANDNVVIRISAKYLAAVDRIATPKKAYVVWVVTDRDGARNIGKLMNRNSRTAKLETLIPSYSTEVFITAEEDGEAVTPSGVEISRIKFEK